MDNTIAVALITFLATACLSLIGFIFTRQTARTDRAEARGEHKQEKVVEKQSTQAEIMAGVLARVGQLETDRGLIASALDRLARLEEFRGHAMPRLEEAEATARGFIAMQEQIKTVFKRLDAIPGEVVDLLKLHVRSASRSPA